MKKIMEIDPRVDKYQNFPLKSCDGIINDPGWVPLLHVASLTSLFHRGRQDAVTNSTQI